MWCRELVPSLKNDAEQSKLTVLNNNSKNMLKTLALTCTFFFCTEHEKCAEVLCVGWPSTSELYCIWIRNYCSMLVHISLEIGTFMQNGYHGFYQLNCN